MYDNIKEKSDYDKLLATGMFWEFHPELTGAWEIDKVVILRQPEPEKQEVYTMENTNEN